MRWSVVPLAAGVLITWALAWAAGRLVGRLERTRWAQLISPVEDLDRLKAERAVVRAASQRLGWLEGVHWPSLAGVTFSFAVVAISLVSTSRTPEAFPQHPDTIFHLADAQWMLERDNISSLHANGFIFPSGTGFYPAAFHGFTATVSMLTGVPVVVATSCLVLASAGLVWPLGMFLLARSVVGNSAGVVLATAVAAVAFTGFPYFLMGFGVLWPNLFGQTLLPGCLAILAAALARLITNHAPAATPLRAAIVLAASIPGLALAHPNAFISFALFAYLMLVGALLGRAWARRRRPRTATAYLGGTLLSSLFAAWVVGRIRPENMLKTGAIGPELPFDAALEDLIFLAPRGAGYLPLLSAVTLFGAVVLLYRRRGAGWVVAALGIMFGLYFLNVTVDSWELRNLTWPWYNNAVRMQAVAILPATLAAAAGLSTLGLLIARPLRRFAWAPMAGTSTVLVAFVAATSGYMPEHEAILNRYFHPPAANSWASPAELRWLHSLASHVPEDGVVAANPWNGGTYLYVVSGRHLLVPTEKANMGADRILLSARLDDVGTDPEVCAAARRQGVTHAITGGQPFSWVSDRMRLYVGIDSVGTSPAFEKVAAKGHYTLYRMTECAGA
jgi:hypothetical protein